MTDFLEDDMAEVIIAHTEELLGEPLTLLERKLWIGRYELDLLFRDRHGAKVIVELQRGTLDRYHLYKVLDYYDEYKDRHPHEFVEVMVVANLISPDRKERLAKRGINFKEIPADLIKRYLKGRPTAAAEPDSPAPSKDLFPQTPIPENVTQPPEWFKSHLANLYPGIRSRVQRLASLFQCCVPDVEVWGICVAIADNWQRRWAEQPSHDQYVLPLTIDMGFAHLYWSRLARRVGFNESQFARASQYLAPDLIPFLRLGFFTGSPAKFLTARETTLGNLVQQCIENPLFLLELCGSFRSFWSRFPEGLSSGECHLFLELLGGCLGDIVREVSIRLFTARAIPIGVDSANRFITRPIELLGHPSPNDLFDHLAIVLALQRNLIVRLWNEGELLSHSYVEGAFPVLDNPFEIGTELLINAYGSKAYTIDRPSEVLIQAGDVKSIVLVEVQGQGCVYKVRYRDDTITFGQVALQAMEDGDLICDQFSSNAILGYTKLKAGTDSLEDFKRAVAGGGEFALVSAIIRDFLVCEEREAHYSIQGGAKILQKSQKKPGIVIRYLPRFRVRYIGLREREYKNQRIEVLGHHVSGHLRRCRTASPLQLLLAEQFNVPVPDGFTFVQPHDRGRHTRVLYRSKSAVRMIYG